MADQTLALSTSSKTSAAPLQSSDLLRVVRGSTSYKADMVAVAAYLAAGMSALTPQFTGIELGHATDTTISRASAGRIAVEGSNVLMASDIGVTVQAYDADLAAWSALSPTLYSTTAQIAAAYQPLDADLTAWAAVNPSSYSTTSQIAAAYQPLDGDLTAIAALTTTSTGRALLTVADAAAIRTAAGLGTSATVDTGTSGATVPLLSGSNTASGAWTFTNASPITLSAATARLDWYATGDGADAKRWAALANGGIFYLQTRTDADVFGATALSITRSGTTVTAIALAATTVTINGTAIASAAFKATGTSGNTVPLLDGANTWSGAQTFQQSTDTIVTVQAGSGYGAVYVRGSGTNATYMFFGNGTNNERSRLISDNSRDFVISNDSGVTSHLRVGATGVLTASGVAIPTISSTDTLSNKTIASPTLSGTVAGTAAWTTASYLGLSGTSSAAPYFTHYVTDAGTNEKRWYNLANSSGLFFRTVNDAFNAEATWLSVTRSGLTPVAATFGTCVVFPAATTSLASARIPSGTAPSSPTAGDLWYDGTNLKFRDGGTTRTITWT